MPHERQRLLLSLLEKRLNHFPVVGVLGARQTGKSTLLRDLLSQRRTLHYVTLDREEVLTQAKKQPTAFLQNLEDKKFKTVCIDEVQKAPVLFDTIKAEVDENKRPGRFALSGSTEFSKAVGIRESLTGRIALTRLYPLNLAEIIGTEPSARLLDATAKTWSTAAKPQLSSTSRSRAPLISLKDITLWTKRGGMPGIFAIRDDDARVAQYESWIETTCSRDMSNFKISRFSADLARRILKAVATCEISNRGEIASIVGKDPRSIEPYLQAFKSLFVLYEIEPHRTGVGKPTFFLFDSGMANYLGASSQHCLSVWFLNECLSQHSYAGKPKPDIFYYKTTRGSIIDFVIENQVGTYGCKLSEEEAPSTYQLRAVEAFSKKHPSIQVAVLCPCTNTLKLNRHSTLMPWTAIT